MNHFLQQDLIEQITSKTATGADMYNEGKEYVRGDSRHNQDTYAVDLMMDMKKMIR